LSFKETPIEIADKRNFLSLGEFLTDGTVTEQLLGTVH
jgi:hypothetical protein